MQLIISHSILRLQKKDLGLVGDDGGCRWILLQLMNNERNEKWSENQRFLTSKNENRYIISTLSQSSPSTTANKK